MSLKIDQLELGFSIGPMVQEKMHYLTLTQNQGHMKCCLVPSTSCDLCTGKLEVATSKSL